MTLNLSIFRNKNVKIFLLFVLIINMCIPSFMLLSLYVIDLTHSILYTGLIDAIPIILVIFTAPFIGSFVDKYDKLKLINKSLIYTSSLIFLSSIILLFNNYYLNLATSYVLSISIGLTTFVVMNFLFILRERLVLKEDLVQFNTIFSTTIFLSSSIGSPLAMVIYIQSNFSILLFIMSLLIFLSSLVIKKIKYEPINNSKVSVLKGAREGIKYLLKRTDMIILLFLSLLIGLSDKLIYKIIRGLYTEYNLDNHIFYYGTISLGLGVFIISILSFYKLKNTLIVLVENNFKLLLFISIGVFVIMQLVKNLLISVNLFLILIVPLFIAYSTVLTLLSILILSLIHKNTNPVFMGRVFSFYYILSQITKITDKLIETRILLTMVLMVLIIIVMNILVRFMYKNKIESTI